MQRTLAEHYAAPSKTTALTKKGTDNHVAQFTPARDSRNRRVPGLYIRNGRYYCQLWVDRGDGRKSARRFPHLTVSFQRPIFETVDRSGFARM